jgi:hypothetical protein
MPSYLQSYPLYLCMAFSLSWCTPRGATVNWNSDRKKNRLCRNQFICIVTSFIIPLPPLHVLHFIVLRFSHYPTPLLLNPQISLLVMRAKSAYVRTSSLLLHSILPVFDTGTPSAVSKNAEPFSFKTKTISLASVRGRTYRPNDLGLSAKLVPNFADREVKNTRWTKFRVP